MPSRIKFFRSITVLFAAGVLSASGAQVFTETFGSGSNGWHWVKPSGTWGSSFTGGFARISIPPAPEFIFPTDVAKLSSTNIAVVSGGAFTGNYQAAQIKSVGCKYFASKIVYNSPEEITSRVEIRWGNSSNYYYKFFTPSETGVWQSFEADLRCYDKGGWSSPSGATYFDATLQDVRFLEFRVTGRESLIFFGTTNTFLIDDIFVDYVRISSNRTFNQTITFPTVADQVSTNVLSLSASADSGLPVYFSVASGPAVIAGCDSVTFTGTGVVAIVATQNGDTNFNAAASVTNTFVVNEPKPVAAVELLGLTQTYDGTARVVAANTTPTGLAVIVTYNGSLLAPTNAGQYVVTGLVNDLVYEGMATGTLVVAKADAPVSLAGLLATYDGTGKCITLSTTPSNLNVSVTYDDGPVCPTNAGSYTVVATINEMNYAGISTGTLVVAKAIAVVTLSDLAHTYDGTGKCASVTTTPAGLNVNVTYDGLPDCPTNAGSYLTLGEVNESNYAGSSTSTTVISKASAAVYFPEDVSATYSGLGNCVAADTIPAGLFVVLTYDGLSECPSNAGTYNVVGTISNQNYAGSSNISMVISKAMQGISFGVLPEFVEGDEPQALVASASSGLPVAFASSDSAVASVSGSTLMIMGAGSADITASQAGGVNYESASNVVRVAVVSNLVAELDARLSGLNIRLDVLGNTGRTYTVQHASDLMQTNWQTLTVITNLPTATYQVLDPMTNAARHYRLIRPVWSP